MITVPVVLAGRGYDVEVGPGASGLLGDVVARRVPGARRAAVVTDDDVSAQPWFSRIDPGVPFGVHVVGRGERAKNLSTIEALCRAFVRAGLSRTDVVVAVGGGVVSDIAGFAAAVYHRGTSYCTVATSLLAQVDAAIGGKTGVDLPEGKNLVGAFWQPEGVLADTALLETLPDREVACGRGEMAKYAFLGEPGLVDLPVDEQVARSAALKAEVVAADEHERGRRVVLNYGHTLAHALEAAALSRDADLRHGEAVAVGLVYAAVLARRLGRVGDETVARHREVVARFGLSDRLPPWCAHGGGGAAALEELVGYMARDKKADHDLSFVLDGPGGVGLVRDVAPADALGALGELAALCDEDSEGVPCT